MNFEAIKTPENKPEFPAVGLLFPELPPDMVVVIDGEAVCGKRTVGEIVAKELGAVLINTIAYYGCLLLSCLEARIDLSDPAEIWKFYARARVDVSVKNGIGDCDEASILVNGDFFGEDELEVARDHPLIPAIVSVTTDIVRLELKHAILGRRMVVLGWDLSNGVLKGTPFKFSFKAKRNGESRTRAQQTATGPNSRYAFTSRRRYDKKTAAMEIDVNARSPIEVSDEILTKVVLRNSWQEDRIKNGDHCACRKVRLRGSRR